MYVRSCLPKLLTVPIYVCASRTVPLRQSDLAGLGDLHLTRSLIPALHLSVLTPST